MFTSVDGLDGTVGEEIGCELGVDDDGFDGTLGSGLVTNEGGIGNESVTVGGGIGCGLGISGDGLDGTLGEGFGSGFGKLGEGFGSGFGKLGEGGIGCGLGISGDGLDGTLGEGFGSGLGISPSLIKSIGLTIPLSIALFSHNDKLCILFILSPSNSLKIRFETQFAVVNFISAVLYPES